MGNEKGNSQGQGQGQGQNQSTGKSKQTLKPQGQKQQGQKATGLPSKQQKRTNSEISEASANDSMNASLIQNQLDIVQEDVAQIRETLKSLLKKDDIKQLIEDTVNTITASIEKKLMVSLEEKLSEKTKELQDQIDSLVYENNQLKDKLTKNMKESNKRIKDLEEKMKETDKTCVEANKRSNRNEQYSRKNNVKVQNIPVENNESKESLLAKVQNTFKRNSIDLKTEEIIAIHRIPTKRGQIQPVLIKTLNNEAKSKIMRKRKEMKASGHKLVDDVTALNSGLINRLLQHQDIKSAWFFNGYVYGQTTRDERVKFDIYDNIGEVVADYRQNKRIM